MPELIKIDKVKMKDRMGKPLTQSLFLEIGYKKTAMFTLNDQDKEYKGRVYPSLKKLFIEFEDLIEIEFSNKYLLGWRHWKRICNNNILKQHIKEWREELDLTVRSVALKSIIDIAGNDNGFQANRWLADKGWVQKKAGRPSKEQVEEEISFQVKAKELYEGDFERLSSKIH